MSRGGSAAFALVILLRVFSGFMIIAIFALVMPNSWLRTAVAEVEPGTSVDVLVEYLARGWSAFYFILGCLIWLFSMDLRRYAPAGKFIGLCYAVLGGGATLYVTWIAISTPDWEKPWFFWVVLFNLSCGFAFGIPIFLLYRKLMRKWQQSDGD